MSTLRVNNIQDLNNFPFSSGVNIPSGLISMWYGLSIDIPEGWLLCDGTNGTPDLRGRFVVGAGGSYDLDNSGGSSDVVLVDHDHDFSANYSGTTSIQDRNHGHAFTTDNQGQHDHVWGANTFRSKSGGDADLLDNPVNGDNGNKRAAVSPSGQHSHSGTTAGVNSNHAHTFSGTVSGTTTRQGESGINKNLPPYYALFYIMRSAQPN